MNSVKQILREAAQIEDSARDQLAAWCLLGQSQKYGEAMDMAAQLRRAAEMPLATRNEFLRGLSRD